MSQLHRRLNQPRWQQARRAALERDGYRCVECGLPGKLEVHHITALYKGGLPYELDNLESRCRDCHVEDSVFGPRLEWRRHIARFKELTAS